MNRVVASQSGSFSYTPGPASSARPITTLVPGYYGNCKNGTRLSKRCSASCHSAMPSLVGGCRYCRRNYALIRSVWLGTAVISSAQTTRSVASYLPDSNKSDGWVTSAVNSGVCANRWPALSFR